MNKRTLNLCISIVILISLLACSLPRPQTPTAEPTSTQVSKETATVKETVTVKGGPTATPSPTATPTPSPTPLPPTAPLLLNRQPDRGEELDVSTPLVLTFDQPMDRASVEKAFSIEPTVKGQFEWASDRILMFKPEKAWPREAAYRVAVDTTAKSQKGFSLREEVGFRFTTTGYLEVTQAQPADETTEVAMDSTVTVMFNRPVVPLVAVADLDKLPQPLTFDPPVEGKGEWLNTSIYLWTPADGFAPSTTYQVTIKAGLQDTTGGVLANDYSWSFTTQLPRVTQAYPYDEAQFIGPSDVVSVTFNQPMDPASVESKFSLTYEKQTQVPGQFSWAKDKTSFQFKPNAPLPRGVSFTARVDQGALGAAGAHGTQEAYVWRFATADDPRIVLIVPADGAKEVDPYSSVRVDFSAPMDPKTLLDNLTVAYYYLDTDETGYITATQVYSYWNNYDTELYINFGMRASSQFTVTLGAGLKDRWGVPVAEGASSRFTTRALGPLCYFGMPGNVGTFNAYTTTTIIVGYRNISRIDFELYKIGADQFFKLIGEDAYQVREKFDVTSLPLLNAWSLTVAPPRNKTAVQRLRLQDASGNSPAPGLYALQIKSPEMPYGKLGRPPFYLLSISRSSVIIKNSMTSAMVWVTDLKTGEPVNGAQVELYDKLEQLGTGTTDQDGIWSATFDERDMWSPVFALVQRENDLGVALTYWNEGISPWEFNVSTEYYKEPYRSLFYTDRPIYRPGQTVYFKGIVREDNDAIYALPETGSTVAVRVEDSQGRVVYEGDLVLSDMGAVAGEFTLDQEATLGYYYINAVYNDRYMGTGFRVAEYRKPEYQVEVKTDRDQYVQGDTINVTALATYYFGGPVTRAKVRWAVLSDDYYFSWEGPGWYDWREWEWQGYSSEEGYYGGYGGLVAEGTGETDDEGRFTFSVPADIAERINSQVFTLEVTVTDVNNQEVSNRTQTVVHKGLFYIGLAPRRYVGQVDKEQIVDVKVIDLQNQPVADQQVQVVFMEQHWYNTQKEGTDGRWYWEWEVEDIPVYTTTVKTNDKGDAEAKFTPEKGGSYKVRATARDERENEVRSATYLWVSSREWISWRRENNDRIELIADKKEYKVGDTAEILVPSPFRGPVKALVTVERGEILQHQVITLQSNSDVIKVPIKEEHVPNIFVSVALVKGIDESNSLSAFKIGYVALPVSTQTKVLHITLTPDRQAEAGQYYHPRDKVKYDVQVTDHTGKGVEADLSLDLVDLAVLALTGGERGQELLDAFYFKRGVGIQTSASLILSVDRVAAELPITEGKGGGGGMDAGEGLVRTNFADTAYWNASVRTDANGRATVQVELPDNLTTWRLRGRGVTASTLVGEGNVDVISTLDVLVRPVAPRFFVIGDKATLSVVAHNNTNADLEATVTLQATGLDMAGGPQTVQIPSKGKVKVDWPIVVQNVEQVVLRASVKAGDYADAIELTLPVYTYSTPEVVATAGQLDEAGERLEAVVLPQKLDPTQGELTVQVDPSLAAGMRDGLQYLEHYPYECIEQTVSRWLPNVLTYRALKDLGIDDPELAAKLPDLVSQGLQRIYSEQHYDGGWGWWRYSQSNPFLTAYVLLGLVKAKEADLAVDDKVIDQAIQFLQTQFKSPSAMKNAYEFNRQAFVLYALAEAGAGDLSRSVKLFENRDKLSNYAKAYLAMTLGMIDNAGAGVGGKAGGGSDRVKTLLSDLGNAAVLSATGAHWEEGWVDYWSMNTDTRSTAVIIDAFAKLDPENAILPNAVRWLMVARKAGHWETTQETAWALIALTDYMAMTGELEADYSYQIALNGQEIERQTITKQDVGESFRVKVSIVDLLKQEVNQVWVTRGQPTSGQTGKGRLYYALYLRYFLPVEEVKALSRGIIVARQYLPATCKDKQDCQPVTEAKVGEVVRVKITLVAPHDLHFLVLEDPLPAGTEAVDRSLKTTSVVSEEPQLEQPDESYSWWDYGWGWWWFNHSEVRDEKVALFADYLPRGTYEYTYLIRASVPGEFLTLPTMAYEMYFPEVWGRSDGGKFIITE